jgi:hypothetical protein
VQDVFRLMMMALGAAGGLCIFLSVGRRIVGAL